MSDPAPAPTETPAAPSPAAPAAPAPPAAPQQPLPGLSPPAAAAAPAGKSKGKFIRLRARVFKERLDNYHRTKTRAEFGMEPDELKKLVESHRNGKPAPAATPETPATPPAATGKDSEKDELRRKLEKERRKREAAEVSLQKNRTRERDKRISIMLQAEARAAGVENAHADFVLDLYRRAIQVAATENKEAPEPSSFFKELRKTRAYLFAESSGAAPPAVRPATSPPESARPGEDRPAPQPPGGQQKPPENIDEMTPEQFRAYRRSKYGA